MYPKTEFLKHILAHYVYYGLPFNSLQVLFHHEYTHTHTHTHIPPNQKKINLTPFSNSVHFSVHKPEPKTPPFPFEHTSSNRSPRNMFRNFLYFVKCLLPDVWHFILLPFFPPYDCCLFPMPKSIISSSSFTTLTIHIFLSLTAYISSISSAQALSAQTTTTLLMNLLSPYGCLLLTKMIDPSKLTRININFTLKATHSFIYIYTVLFLKFK